METILTVFSGREFLGGRAVAHKVRTEAERVLSANRGAIVVLDFEGVRGISHSFGDELLSSLGDFFDGEEPDRVFLANCTKDVWDDLKSVADMHDLPMFRTFRGELQCT
jgi:hypothetical protein